MIGRCVQSDAPPPRLAAAYVLAVDARKLVIWAPGGAKESPGGIFRPLKKPQKHPGEEPGRATAYFDVLVVGHYKSRHEGKESLLYAIRTCGLFSPL